MTTADAVVIGGGVIGTSIAYRLAEEKRKVILIEKGEIGSKTSGSCDKAIFLQSKKPGFPSELAKASRDIYENLEAELGVPFEFKRGGGMIVVQSEKYLPFIKDFVEKQKQAGIDIQLLDQKEATDRQPSLSENIIGSTYSKEDAEVNPLLLSQAFADAARRKGVEIRTHTEVVDIAIENGKVVGVQTAKEYIPTEIVVNAAGPFAPHIDDMAGVNIPIQPRRGAILISEKVTPVVKGNILCSQYIAAKHLTEEAPAFGIGLSLGQTDDGNLLIGASREFKGFNQSIESEVLPAIAKHATSIVPSLGNIRIIRSMVGFRPYTGDGLPIIDEARDAEGFIIAAGHEGDGIALAPITGLLVRDLLDRKGVYQSFLEKLKLNRFK
ncbi:NAD(P)/FAD-dependent oxidoreductase [Natribacillus halophilus]|uniref:Sarcosine oxidase subunit beta n=1 Tax=Natribacillus halophilus TaxID=549003 RepID=A0A1G8JXN0_9BACI|nr:FAD-dependent oxidoreductase [Natribacillus halophilus]SDI35380.1 sarcosine oxidase subunit beta [Natribacillus halophilus]